MKAVVVKEPGGAEQLLLKDFSKPMPGKGEILIKVKASAINRTDIVSREGNPVIWPIQYWGLKFLGKWWKQGKVQIYN